MIHEGYSKSLSLVDPLFIDISPEKRHLHPTSINASVLLAPWETEKSRRAMHGTTKCLPEIVLFCTTSLLYMESLPTWVEYRHRTFRVL